MRTEETLLSLTKSQSPLLSFRGRGYRVALQLYGYKIFFQTLDLLDRVVGPVAIPWLLRPLAEWDIYRRRHDYPQFLHLRSAMPPDFWKGLDPRFHYRKMILDWHEGGGAALVYHRLGEPSWQKRLQVKGTPLQSLPEWGTRPVILSFMHTGLFGLVRFWLRAQGVPTAALVGGLPLMVDNKYYQEILDAGDRRYGLEGVPHIFQRYGKLRDAIRFLTPGHVLMMALDGGRLSDEADQHTAGGLPILAKNGACRMAAQTDAIVVPVSFRRTALCQFEIRFGNPVPDELIRQGDFTAATQHLIDDLWQGIRENPSDLNWTTLEALFPELRAKRTGWP